MFAIRVSPENAEQITEVLIENSVDTEYLNTYIRSRAEWYLVRGYVGKRGDVVPWAILPGYYLKRNFEIDFEKAQTEWDQIVRKERP